MGWLFEFLKDNPILLFFILAAVANLVGSVAQAKRKAASRRPPKPPKSKQSTATAAWPEQKPQRAEPTARRAPAAARPPVAQAAPAVPGQEKSTADEIAAEMRRILGMDVEVQPVETKTREPIRREPVRKPAVPEPVPTAVAPTAGKRKLQRQSASHVGERMASRAGPRSGRVGDHDASWGSLGGRHVEAIRVAPVPVQSLVDLRDLKRVILGAEILGPPVALRAPDQRMI